MNFRLYCGYQWLFAGGTSEVWNREGSKQKPRQRPRQNVAPPNWTLTASANRSHQALLTLKGQNLILLRRRLWRRQLIHWKKNNANCDRDLRFPVTKAPARLQQFLRKTKTKERVSYNWLVMKDSSTVVAFVVFLVTGLSTCAPSNERCIFEKCNSLLASYKFCFLKRM